MTALSLGSGWALGPAPVRRRLAAAVPALGAAALAFGVVYAAGAFRAAL